eukprot:scaffold183818_cov25-Tisochrysis_lutea.AAC.1
MIVRIGARGRFAKAARAEGAAVGSASLQWGQAPSARRAHLVASVFVSDGRVEAHSAAVGVVDCQHLEAVLVTAEDA